MISVIIPTCDAEPYIEKLCHSIVEQSVLCELIVIDSQSQDKTVEIAKKTGANIIAIKRNDFNHGTTRNLAAASASGDVLVFLTQDALPVDRFLIEKLTGPLVKDGHAAAYGRHIARAGAIPTERFARLFNYPEAPVVKRKDLITELGIKTFFFSNVCSAVSRQVFDELGGFPKGVILNEDMYFGARLIEKGHSIAYVPEACVIHSHNYGFFTQFRRYFDIGVFFSQNRWLLEFASLQREGYRLVWAEFAYLLESRAIKWMPYAILEILAKQSGYNAGLHYRQIPHLLLRYLSYNRGYWTPIQY